jgi:hypothetical protein
MPPQDSPNPITTVTVLAIGTGSGPGSPAPAQLVETPAGHKDVIITFITPVVAITVGFVVTFLTVLLAVIAAAGASPDMIPFADFMQLLTKAAKVALTGASINLLKDLLTLFTSLKSRFPLLGV